MPSAMKSPATKASSTRLSGTGSSAKRPVAARPGATRHGATRRSAPHAESGLDRWLDLLVSVSVITAMVVGGIALIVTLLFT